jgi:hypothetical protein
MKRNHTELLKFEARNPKYETSTKFQNTNDRNRGLEFGEFEF